MPGREDILGQNEAASNRGVAYLKFEDLNSSWVRKGENKYNRIGSPEEYVLCFNVRAHIGFVQDKQGGRVTLYMSVTSQRSW